MLEKNLFLKQILFALLFLCVLIFQNRIWPVLFGLPVFLFVPFLVYVALYQKTGFVIFMLYFISFALSASSALPFSFLLVFNGFFTLVLFLFRKVYSINTLFFCLTCALILFLFPAFLFLFAQLMGEKPYIYGPLFWIGGGMVSWIFCLPLLKLFQALDRALLSQTVQSQRRGEG